MSARYTEGFLENPDIRDLDGFRTLSDENQMPRKKVNLMVSGPFLDFRNMLKTGPSEIQKNLQKIAKSNKNGSSEGIFDDYLNQNGSGLRPLPKEGGGLRPTCFAFVHARSRLRLYVMCIFLGPSRILVVLVLVCIC